MSRFQARFTMQEQLRDRLTHPLSPVVLLAVGAMAAASFQGPVILWAMVGGLAGYSLSGSV